MKIYLDFDDTIFDTNSFTKELIRIFNAAGFTEKDFYDNLALTKKKVGGFDLDTIFNYFVAQHEFDARKTRRSIDNIFSNADVFVHNDLFDFIKEFPKEKLALLSLAAPTPFQREKIENSKIVPYFSEIIVTPRNKEESFKEIAREHKGKQLFFVEDRADQIDRVKASTPQVTAMKIERPSGRYSDIKSELADYIVKDLYGVTDIIKGKVR